MNDRARPMPSLRSRAACRRNESGAAIVEFALVVGLFMMLLYGFIAFGMALALKQQATNAAAAGARSAVGQPAGTAAATAKQKAIEAMGGTTKCPDVLGDCIVTASVVAPGPQCLGSTTSCVVVTVRAWPFLKDGLGLAVPDTVESTAKVQL